MCMRSSQSFIMPHLTGLGAIQSARLGPGSFHSRARHLAPLTDARSALAHIEDGGVSLVTFSEHPNLPGSC